MTYLIPDWPAPKQVHALTTLRQTLPQGISRPDHDTDLITRLSLPAKPVWLHQIHSNIAVEALPLHQGTTADAAYTQQINHVCAVLTADCLPILLCNTAGTQVAAIHAGWRGLASGIIENTLAQLSFSHDDWLAWLGPAIGPDSFEVGDDVLQAFMSHDERAKEAFIPKSEGKWLANLYQLARQRLQTLGVSNIYGGNYCTFTQSDMFYSYRRDKGQTGRMATLIWMS